jgi:NDP-sugar pyrophosphorylase family protein
LVIDSSKREANGTCWRAACARTVRADGHELGLHVSYSHEDTLLGTAGGPRRALPLLGADRFFVVNGDTLTDVDLRALASEHARTGALVTMALIRNPDPAFYGGVVVVPAAASRFRPARRRIAGIISSGSRSSKHRCSRRSRRTGRPRPSAASTRD